MENQNTGEHTGIKYLPPGKSFLDRRIRSFGYAFKGIGLFISTQPNGWIHICATAGVTLTGWWVGLSTTEWLLIAFCIGSVFMAEIMNTAVEFLVDMVSPGFHRKAGQVKDLAAGAVLVSSIMSVVIGSVIFLPRLWKLFGDGAW